MKTVAVRHPLARHEIALLRIATLDARDVRELAKSRALASVSSWTDPGASRLSAPLCWVRAS